MCATTGIAAVNLGEGTTINALLKYFDTASLEEAYTAGYLQANLRKHRRAGLRRILLDEVSMLDGHQLTLLVRALDEINATGSGWETSAEDEEQADQGVQVGLTLVGDFCQLPPVKAPFAFESPEWGRFADHTLSLTKVQRQGDQDFVEALRAVRRGQPKLALEVLRDCLADKALGNFDGPTLLAKNDAVDRYNSLRLDTLKGDVVLSKASRWGTQRTDWKQIPELLTLKPGALVMVLANAYDHEEERYLYVNGDLGVFEGWASDGKSARVTLQRGGVEETVKVITRENLQPLEVGERKALKAAGLAERIKDKSKVIGAISYLPLRVAYSTTVHKCVAADTRVPVHGRGYVAIDSVNLDDITPYGRILNRVRSMQWAYRVTTKRGYNVVCSADHRWSTRDGWIETRDLDGRDIELHAGTPFSGDESLGPGRSWLLGAIVGDGCYTDRDDGTIHFSCMHQVFGEMFLQEMERSFGIRPSWRKDRRGMHWSRKRHREELERYGLGYVKAECKRVPHAVWQLCPRDRGAFLQGLFDTDGHFGRNRLVLTTASPKLAEEVQELLLTLGIVCSRSSYPGVKASTYWQLYIGAESLDRFQRYVGFRHPDKAALLYTSRPNRVLRPTNGYERVVTVAPLGLELPMVDIELASPYTVAFGPFVGHNSQGLSLDQVQVSLREPFMAAAGMVYVALSRCKTKAGLRIVGSPETFLARCVADKRLAEWL